MAWEMARWGVTLRQRIETLLREAALNDLEASSRPGATEEWRRERRGTGMGLRHAIGVIDRAFREHENEKRSVRRRRRRSS